MKFIDYQEYDGKKNMQIDLDLLEESVLSQSQEPIFRLYGWKPSCVSLGRNQSDSFLDKKLLEKLNIDYVKRLTGGRALFHDMELTYSYITPASLIERGDNIQVSYEYISGIWIEIFKYLDINLTIGGLERHITKDNYCMSVSTGADLCFNNKKFIGSAQCRKNGYILQHGSILLDYNKSLIDKIFAEDTDFSSIISLKQIDNSLTIYDIIEAVKSYIKSVY